MSVIELIVLPVAVIVLTLVVFMLGYWLGVSQGRRQGPRRVDFNFHVDVHDNEVFSPLLGAPIPDEDDEGDSSEAWKQT